ncbi:MAG: hypothetical protein JXO22_18410 [Phycisphaerae bacterium]|nr:hypothetical protein [Phycisphaerae bacterium]
MPFEVYAGTVTAPAAEADAFPPVTMDDDHRAYIVGSMRTVYVSRGEAGLRATIAEHEGSTAVQATRVMVFINELGRHVTVRWVEEQEQEQEGAADAPRVQVSTIAVRANRWHVIPSEQNFDESRIAEDRRDEIRPTPSGTSCTFKTSMCGKDLYIVVFEPEGQAAEAQYCCVTVIKRITCHYREMPQSSGATETWSLRSVLRETPLQTVRQHYLEEYGIYLVGWDTAESNLTWRETAQANQPAAQSVTHALIPAAQRADPPDRELWIGSFNKIRDGTTDLAGVGGGHVVGVALHWAINETLPALRSWWRVRETTGRMPAELDQIAADERPFYSQLARGLCDHPDVIVGRGITRTLMHEIGHALGLVPSNEQAAGNAQSSWHSSGHHCSADECVMNASAESYDVAALMRRQFDQPFDGHGSINDPAITGRCALYLIACDLSDLNNPS